MVRESKEQKKQRIFDVAIRLLNDKTYEEIRIEDIMKELRMAKSMFFYYFASKAELYLEILCQMHASVVQMVQQEMVRYNEGTYDEFKEFILSVADQCIQRQYSFIGLFIYEERIYSECPVSSVRESRMRIEKLYDELFSQVLMKFDFLDRNEVFYTFEIQSHLLRGYYNQMIVVSRYLSGEKREVEFERKSLYEFRVARMMRYFLDGIIHEKETQK